jgi:hypothetical protein
MIADIANHLFYENYLLNGINAASRKRLIKGFEPVTFVSAEKGMVNIIQIPKLT